MSTARNDTSGYLYRIARADAATLRKLVGELVLTPPQPAWSFGGAAMWDIDPKGKKEHLRPITLLSSADELNLEGDFGHAFSQAAELRWKRIDRDHYDLLVLSERSLSALESDEYRLVPPDQISVRYPQNVAIQLEGRRHAGNNLHYVEYRVKSGAVQFLRYREVR